MIAPSEPGNRRILVIDDTASIHDDIRKILDGGRSQEALDEVTSRVLGKPATSVAVESLAYEVDSAYQGAEGVAMVEAALRDRRPYALVFVDMRMPPGWDGVETIERLWAIDPHLEVVICTAFSDYSWNDMFERLGSTDQLLILKKPFEHAEIHQLGCALTNKWNLGRSVRTQVDELERLVAERTAALQRTNQQLIEQAHHDPLTRLPNRSLLVERVRLSIARATRRDDYQFSVLFLDIDNFKHVNDSLGHDAGDGLLVQVSERLGHCLREIDSVTRADANTTARLGGDEFVLLLDGIHDPNTAVLVADRIQSSLQAPMTVDGHEIVISCSIGITFCNDGRKTVDDLLREADTAMYRAKSAGKGQHAVFDETMHAESRARLELERDVRRAVEARGFIVHYQPIVHLESGELAGFEAILRWDHPTRGMLDSTEFLSLVEDRKLIVTLGQQMLDEACRQLAEWAPLRPHAPLFMSVNLSRSQLLTPNMVDELQQVLDATGIDPAALHLEIPERAIVDQLATVMPVLDRAKACGVTLSLDDFGNRSSTLACLHELPIDVLKINRGLWRSITNNREYTGVIDAIVRLAHVFGMKVTCEGIEHIDQVAEMFALECNFAQGSLFSPPIDAAAARGLVVDLTSLVPAAGG